MTQNPLINALAAALYIFSIVSLLFYFDPDHIQEPNALLPIAMLSLFTLSAAVMGYLFVFQPLRLFLEGEKERAVRFFLQTVGAFALVTVALFATLLAVTS